jgi:isopenicillin N synthase-like dioxygenase
VSFHVPTVDVTSYVHGGTDEQKRETASRFAEARRSVGFIQITSYGVSGEVIAGLTTALDDFFGLSFEEKKQHVRPARIDRGYSPPRSEATSLSLGAEAACAMNDLCEAYNVGLEPLTPGSDADEFG